MILAQQWGNKDNSRIGNSLMWMSLTYKFFRSIGVDVCYPLAHDLYDHYFDRESYWLNDDIYSAASKIFASEFACDLSSVNLISQMKGCQNYFESNDDPAKRAFFEKYGAIKISSKATLFSGNYNFCSEEFSRIALTDELLIIQEPFAKLNTLPPALKSHNFQSIAPSQSLYFEQQRLLNLHCGDLKKYGVHIRRKDYAVYGNGKYFYSDDFWIELIKKILSRQDCAVIIFSDDDVSSITKNFNFDPRLITTDSVVENDFVKFMLMDFIFSVPSTFPYMAKEISKNIFNNKNINHIELHQQIIPDF